MEKNAISVQSESEIKSVRTESEKTDRSPELKEIALERCEEHINWYKAATTRNRRLYRWSTTLAIFLGGLTPILVVLQALYGDYQTLLMVLAALFPALAAIITGINGLYQWRDNYARVAHTAELFKSEKVKFLTRSSSRYRPDLSEQEIVNNFVTRIESISLKETSDWRTQFDEGIDLNEALHLVLETRSALATNTDISQKGDE